MITRIQCSCGAVFEVDSATAGSSVECTDCGRMHLLHPAYTHEDEVIDTFSRDVDADKRKDHERKFIPLILTLLAIVGLCLILLYILLAKQPQGIGSGGTGRGSSSGNLDGGGQGTNKHGTVSGGSSGKDGTGGAAEERSHSGVALEVPQGKESTEIPPPEPESTNAPPKAQPDEFATDFSKKRVPAKSGREGSPGGGGGSGNIFDREGRGTKFVYVIDFSGSMNGARLAAAKAELIDSIENLHRSMEFYVIFFDEHYETMPEPGMVKATQENLDRAIRWIESMSARGGTDPTGAMMKALDLNPHTIFLLSDGIFSATICESIRKANADGQVSICTIAFHDRSGEAVLRRIAEENHGDYRFVPAPAESAPNKAGASVPRRINPKRP